MSGRNGRSGDARVRVGVRVRCLLPREKVAGSRVCTSHPAANQVTLGGTRVFAFDHVFTQDAGQVGAMRMRGVYKAGC